MHCGEGHHHRGQALVAGGDTDDAFSRRVRTDESAEDRRRVVAVGQGIHHPVGALGAAVAGIADEAGERHAAERGDRFRDFLHQETDLEVTGVITERDGFAIGLADPALGREDEIIAARDLVRGPAHADVLRPAEEVAARMRRELFLGEGQDSARPGGFGAEGVDRFVAGV